MKAFMRALSMAIVCFLVSCNSNSNQSSVQSAVRGYNGTAAVGDFLTISINSAAQTITYKNYSNGETGTVPYHLNSNGTYTIADPNGNLLTAYQVPGTVMMVEAANAGTQRNTTALITAIESVPVTIQTFAGRNFNYLQFRTSSGGVELGTSSVDTSGDISHAGYWPYGTLSQQDVFNSGTFPASSLTEDPSGNFFTITESSSEIDYVFGTVDGFFAVDTNSGTILGLPKASSKNFNPANAGNYTALYYEKPNAQMGQNNVESGTPSEGLATITVGANGTVTMTDSQNNTMATGTLAAIADTSYVYNGTPSELPDPLYGMFTFRTSTSSSQQDLFVSFQNNAIIFASFETGLPIQPNGTYMYFYGVGLK